MELPNKEVKLHIQPKNLFILTKEIDASNSQCTGYHQHILIYNTYKMLVKCISVQVHLLGTKLLEIFLTHSTHEWTFSIMRYLTV